MRLWQKMVILWAAFTVGVALGGIIRTSWENMTHYDYKEKYELKHKKL